jgi:hypothetical protein
MALSATMAPLYAGPHHAPTPAASLTRRASAALSQTAPHRRMVVVASVVDGASSTAGRPAPSDGIGREAR